MIKIGVHLTHCCRTHGCRYGNSSCPVASGEREAENRLNCEICYDITIELRDEIAVVPASISLQRKDNMCEEWTVVTQLGAIPLVFYFTGAVVINTAPYIAEQLEWITAKVKLFTIMHGGQ